MNATARPEKQRRCSLCGHVPLQRRLIDESFEYGADNERLRVEAHGVPVEVCESCGETYFGPEAARVHHEAVCRALGLLVPDEIRAIREHLALSQSQFAQLTGIDEATISGWERGRLLQTKAFDRYLRLLARNAENVRFLAEVDSMCNEGDKGAVRPAVSG